MEDEYLDSYYEDQFDLGYDEPWERDDDYNVFEERQLDLDDEGEDFDDFEPEPVEDFGYFGEMGLHD